MAHTLWTITAGFLDGRQYSFDTLVHGPNLRVHDWGIMLRDVHAYMEGISSGYLDIYGLAQQTRSNAAMSSYRSLEGSRSIDEEIGRFSAYRGI